MTGIHVGHVTKKMKLAPKRFETVFDDFSLDVGEGETLGIFGPNGCGKTTLFNMISGILNPDSGQICVHGKKPKERNIAYIFQDYRNSLFPWLTIRDNIIFPLKIKKMKQTEIDRKLQNLLDLVKITFDLSKYPYQLSGGQQQYVAILRGLISDPDVMLVDEPFSALDYSNSMWLMEKISRVQEKIKISSMLVAHDIEHLVYLADRIVFLSVKPARVVWEKTLEKVPGRARLRFDYDLLDEIKRVIKDIYVHDPDQSGLGEI
ncbi:MAG: ATP-binding cassette domain-containing protein [Deltaproteobacteria bacterium]|nr:ATP-binding cassette domain-containing protein [Deltaproteobacteria bacterium]